MPTLNMRSEEGRRAKGWERPRPRRSRGPWSLPKERSCRKLDVSPVRPVRPGRQNSEGHVCGVETLRVGELSQQQRKNERSH